MILLSANEKYNLYTVTKHLIIHSLKLLNFIHILSSDLVRKAQNNTRPAKALNQALIKYERFV